MELKDIFKKLEEADSKPENDSEKVYLHYVILANYQLKFIDFNQIKLSDIKSYATDVENCVIREGDDGDMYFEPGSLIGNIFATDNLHSSFLSTPGKQIKTRHFV